MAKKFKQSKNSILTELDEDDEYYPNLENPYYTEKLKKHAQNGHALAQLVLGVVYANGYGIKTDLKKARTWLEKSANQGIRGAEFNLGTMLFYGQGGKQNQKKGFELWTISAYKKHPEALFILGQLYENGVNSKDLEIEPDREKAREFYKKSAQQGNAPAQKALLELNKKCPPQSQSSESQNQSINTPPNENNLYPNNISSISIKQE